MWGTALTWTTVRGSQSFKDMKKDRIKKNNLDED